MRQVTSDNWLSGLGLMSDTWQGRRGYNIGLVFCEGYFRGRALGRRLGEMASLEKGYAKELALGEGCIGGLTPQ